MINIYLTFIFGLIASIAFTLNRAPMNLSLVISASGQLIAIALFLLCIITCAKPGSRKNNDEQTTYWASALLVIYASYVIVAFNYSVLFGFITIFFGWLVFLFLKKKKNLSH